MCVILASITASSYAQEKKAEKQVVDTVKKATADTTKKAKPTPKPTVAEKTKSAKVVDGLFKLYRDTTSGSLQFYVGKDQLDKDYIYQSFSISGPTSLFLNQNMIRNTKLFTIRKRLDRIEFLEKNTNFYYDKDNAVSKSANVDVSETIFYSEKFSVEDKDGYLINVDGLFLSDKLDPVKPIMPPGVPPTAFFNLGTLSASKSKYENVRSFPKNTDVVVNLAYDNPAPMNGGGKDITDARYVNVKLQHSFLEVPQNDFRPRRDDPRVGYFGAEVDNLTSVSVTPYKDFISRWYLKKKNPSAKLSEPVEPIVFWIENTTPVELRSVIKEAGEKWNEAFEKAGYKNAVVMKQMPDNADWDPADVSYNVIRWVSSAYPSYGAIGPSFFNPLTGQILGADITVEWKSGVGTIVQDQLFNGYSNLNLPWENPAKAMEESQMSFTNHKHKATCQLAAELSAQFQTGLTTIEALDADAPEAKRAAAVKEMHKQFLYYLILHEMGHTLGLNHNMKASQMLSPAELHNTSITRKIGLQGSVMDYPAINVNQDRSKQGDYYTTKTGPYDWWAIEYGYTEFSAKDEEAGLNKILSKSTDPQLAFGNDADDMRSPGRGVDPRTNINDHSNDMVVYGEDRFKLVNTMMPKLKDRFTKNGQSYQELKARFGQLNGQRNSMAAALSRYIGGVYVDRSFGGQETTSKPYTPVPVEYQKKAMEILNKYVFAPNAFDADQTLLPYLQTQRRFFSNADDIKPLNSYAGIQLNVLAHILHPNTLNRVNNISLIGNGYPVNNIMADLTKNIFDADLGGTVNVVRQNLQTEYVKAMSNILSAPTGYDNMTKAAAMLNLQNIKTKLSGANGGDEQTNAHRKAMVFIIEKALAVK